MPYDAGLAAVERLRPLVPPGATLAQLALRWILMFDDVTCAIPGAKTEAQARENAAAGSLPPLSPDVMIAVEQLYDERIDRSYTGHGERILDVLGSRFSVIGYWFWVLVRSSF